MIVEANKLFYIWMNINFKGGKNTELELNQSGYS